VQRAEALTRPWSDLFTGIVPDTGYIIHTDATPPPQAAFYRLRDSTALKVMRSGRDVAPRRPSVNMQFSFLQQGSAT